MRATLRCLRRVLLGSVLWATGWLLVAPAPAWAQAWPSGPITMVMTFPAGSGVDVVARLLTEGGFERVRVVPLTADPRAKGPALFAAVGQKAS